MRINAGEIQRVVSDETYLELSKEYFDHNVVEAMEVVHIGYDHFYSIKANILVRETKSECFVALSEQGVIRSTHCDCEEHSSHSACAHVGSVLFHLETIEPRNFPFYYKNDQRAHWETIMRNIREQKEKDRREAIEKSSSDFLESLGMIDFKLDMSAVGIEATLSDEQGLEVSYRVGNKTKYVVKDIKDFLLMVSNKTSHSYGKNLVLNHDIENFDEESKKQIEFMNRLMSDNSIMYEQMSTRMRSLLLTHATLDAFFELYHNILANYRSFATLESEIKLKINVEELEDGDLSVSLGDDLKLHIGQKHLYTFDLGVLVRFEMDAYGKGMALANHFMEHDSLIVKKDQIEAFFRNVITPLENTFDFQGDVPRIELQDLRIKIYGDIDDFGQIYLQMEGLDESNNVVHSFSEHSIELMHQIEDIVKVYAERIVENRAFFDGRSEMSLNFFQNGMPQFERYAEVYVSDALKRLGEMSRYSIQVGINVSHNLLEIDFDSVEIPKEDLAAVLDAYRKRKRFHKLKNGETISLDSKELEAVDDMMKKYDLSADQMVDGKFEVDQYRMFSLDEFAQEDSLLTFSKGDALKSTIERFKDFESSETTILPHYEPILRDYQMDGFKWFTTLIDYGFGGILADDMGLGKTVQMISVMESLKSDVPSIVICPSSILLNWNDEINKFSKDLNALCIMGTKMERDELIKDITDYDVIITSYDYIRRDIDEYDDARFNCIILDEAQYIKNQNTMNAKSVKELKGNHRFALTGTPIENTLAELWSIFDFLMPGYLHSYANFSAMYERPIVRENDEEKSRELKKLIEPFILRRMKTEVLDELPDKIESTLSFEFNEEERKLYFANLAQVNQTLAQQAEMNESNSIAVLAMLTRLRQICCEPRSIYEDITETSSKMLGALDLIERLRENKQKVLLFSSFTSVLDLMAQELDKRGITYYTLTGKTPRDVRRERVNAFQEDETEVFLISLKAGGTGINLTSAEAVIHFDPWWNVSAQNQATDRAYRIGQHNNVQVFKLIMKDSVEEKIIELQEKKKGLSEAFIENNEGSITTMNHSDILSLFSQN